MYNHVNETERCLFRAWLRMLLTARRGGMCPARSKCLQQTRKILGFELREAEFWGRPLDELQRVAVSKPLIGDVKRRLKKVFGRRVSSKDITMEERWKLDARMRRAAPRKGYDSLVLMAPKAFSLDFNLLASYHVAWN